MAGLVLACVQQYCRTAGLVLACVQQYCRTAGLAGVAPPLSKWSGQEVGVAGCGLSVVL